ncbi:FprA family A-type flavoprotein [Sporosalibacterium faouarense]|uniref:FprA family A-type flavoprotein n=1 Tax=Sporosalibacterium faouarense TaxID=516123 RepID=UPI00141D14AB|nr:FprA family A-type flavoprotein [Sporosalibacterium faouarense]MTI48698.1 FprA family A-type flavoprotein [Bacillota bacterium]
MLNSVNITKDVHYIGVNNRTLELFENLWPLPHGVAYNSYLINDEKVALIDTVQGDYFYEYIDKIQSIIGKDKKIDYLIVNHMEPDHSGLLRAITKLYPEIKIVGNKKTIGMIDDFYRINENVETIDEGDVLDLGNHKLKFYMTPMVHWPETMMTYEENNNILFSGDAFGSFGTLDGGIFDDQVDLHLFEDEMRRYYSNIVGKYGPMVQKAIKKLSDVDIKYICSTHGPIWRNDLDLVISLYDKWSKYEGEEGVVIVYGTMYGNTGQMADTIARSLAQEGIKNIKVYDASKTHPSYLLSDIWKYKGLILGSCAYNASLFPPIRELVHKLKNRNLKNRYLAIFGSYSWSGGGVNNLEKFAAESKFELITDSVEAKSSATEEDIKGCIKIGQVMAKKLKEDKN